MKSTRSSSLAPLGRGLGTALLLVLALGGTSSADGPRVVVDQPVFDFGAVDQGAPVEHTFALRNAGDAELRIENVKSSCGCTVAVASAREVPPGGEGRVSVTLDTARMAGHATKIVTVYTNDPEAAVIALTLSGQVGSDLVVTPSPLYLGRVRRGEPARREVLIVPGRAGTAYIVTQVEHPNPALHANLEARSDGPGQRLVVELDPDVPIGRFNEQLTLTTTSPRQPVLLLPVFGSVEGDVVVLPPQVTFGVARGGMAAERELVIRNRGGGRLSISRVSVPDDLVSYELDEAVDGLEYRLRLRLRSGLAPGKVESAVEIFTDHPGEERLVVPLYAIVRASRDG